VLRESGIEIVFRRLKRQVSNKYFFRQLNLPIFVRELPGLCGGDQKTIGDRLDEELPNVEILAA